MFVGCWIVLFGGCSELQRFGFNTLRATFGGVLLILVVLFVTLWFLLTLLFNTCVSRLLNWLLCYYDCYCLLVDLGVFGFLVSRFGLVVVYGWCLLFGGLFLRILVVFGFALWICLGYYGCLISLCCFAALGVCLLLFAGLFDVCLLNIVGLFACVLDGFTLFVFLCV